VGHGAGLDNAESNPDPSVIQHVTGARATNQIKFTRQGPVLASFSVSDFIKLITVLLEMVQYMLKERQRKYKNVCVCV
jgi:hypothetical protein